MVLLLGIHFADSRLVSRALQHFYGVGAQVGAKILAKHHIHPLAKMGALENKQVLDLTAELSGMSIENEARRQLRANIMRLRDIRSYRGMRHALGYPVRGQRTQTQTVTAKKLNRIERNG